ncbi:MAG: EcsC family protein [Leptospiraceae bacterium]|nr:EcsC family protein [Leptospiraceae bacterium]
MSEFRENINHDYEAWIQTPPNIIQRGLGILSGPIEYLLQPIMKSVAPLLEGVLKSSNQYISEVVKNWSGEVIDIESLSKEEFETWFTQKDIAARDWVSAGVAALSIEGAGTGLGGLALLAADIPASFGLIIGFSNKIALTYQLDISNEEIQIEILKAISAGSETSLKGKVESAVNLKTTASILSRQSWTAMRKSPEQSLPKLIIAVRSILKNLGINLTKRKATQIIPVIGAATGAVINGSWASDSLEAVRQFARKSVTESYYSKWIDESNDQHI